jgi:hypothetical protein
MMGVGVTTMLGGAADMQARLMAARRNTVASRRKLFMMASPRTIFIIAAIGQTCAPTHCIKA